MLGIGLTNYCMRGLTYVKRWNVKWIRISFWSLNIGLAMMTFLSLLPQGVLQPYASIKDVYSHAQSAEFIHKPIIQALVLVRVPGDVVFSVGVFAFGLVHVPCFRARGGPRGLYTGTRICLECR
jgi:nitric oxide reductase subunit B